MSALFSSPRTPRAPPPPAPPPAQDAASVQDAATAARQRAAEARGRNTTVLTATSDVRGGSAQKTLLGS